MDVTQGKGKAFAEEHMLSLKTFFEKFWMGLEVGNCIFKEFCVC